MAEHLGKNQGILRLFGAGFLLINRDSHKVTFSRCGQSFQYAGGASHGVWKFSIGFQTWYAQIECFNLVQYRIRITIDLIREPATVGPKAARFSRNVPLRQPMVDTGFDAVDIKQLKRSVRLFQNIRRKIPKSCFGISRLIARQIIPEYNTVISVPNDCFDQRLPAAGAAV